MYTLLVYDKQCTILYAQHIDFYIFIINIRLCIIQYIFFYYIYIHIM